VTTVAKKDARLKNAGSTKRERGDASFPFKTRHPLKGRGLLFLFDLEYFTPAIGAAMRADLMRRSFVFAGGASDEMRTAQSVMGATTVASAFGNFLFRMRGHGKLLTR